MAQSERVQPNTADLLARIEHLEAQLQRRRWPDHLLRRRAVAAALTCLLALGAGGFAFASLPHASGVIRACKGKNGALRVAGTCAKGEKAVSWNKQGPQGPQGPKGDPGSANAWSLTGNTGNNALTTFLGTTDAQPLVLKTAGKETMRLDATGRVGIGTTSPRARLEVAPANSDAVSLLTSGTPASPALVAQSTANPVTSCNGGLMVGCSASSSDTSLLGINSAGGLGVTGVSASGSGVYGLSPSGYGVEGDSKSNIGIYGTTVTGSAVVGESSTTMGVLGDANSDSGVTGTSRAGPGVRANSQTGPGVFASSSTGVGLLATSQSLEAVVGIVGSGRCPPPLSSAPYAVGGCGASAGPGVFGDSTVGPGVVGTLGGAPCFAATALAACGGAKGDGAYIQAGNGAGGTVLALENTSSPTGCCDLITGSSNGVREFRVSGNGKGFFANGTQTGGQDYAESLPAVAARTLRPGDVLVIDPSHGGKVALSRTSSSPLVAGVYSSRPSVLAVGSHRIGDSLTGEVPVAMLGIVPTRVSAENGPIHVGDLLTTARTLGCAMKATHPVLGTIIGKALQPLLYGKGMIKVMVTLR